MVESDHGEAAEDSKTTLMPGAGEIDAKKMDIVGKRQREDSSEDENSELPNKRQRSQANDRTSETETDSVAEPLRKANGSSTLKDDTMNVDEEELSNENSKTTSAKSDEKHDDADSVEEKENEEKSHNDVSTNNDNAGTKRESIENKNEQMDNADKNDASSEEKPEDDDEEEEEEEEVDDEAESSKEKGSAEKQSGKPSVSKSRTKDPEVVDGLEMSVECASDKEGLSSEGEEDEEEKKKPRPKTIIVKAKPNDSELDASTSEGEKSEDIEEKEEKKPKRGAKKGGKSSPGRKRGKKKGFTKVATSGSDDSDDNASEDEDYSPRTKKKMKKASPSKKTPAKTPGKRRGRQPKKLAKSEEEQSDEQEEDDINLNERSKKGKEKSAKKSLGSEDEDKSEEDTNDALRKNGKKKSKARPEDDKRIQALKKYFFLAGIPIKSYEQFWAGCKSNTARLARMKEALALHGVVGRPTIEKCKKAKARMELKKDVESLSPVGNLSEGRVTRARGGKKSTSPKGDSPSRRDSRGGFKRVSAVVDSESE